MAYPNDVNVVRKKKEDEGESNINNLVNFSFTGGLSGYNGPTSNGSGNNGQLSAGVTNPNKEERETFANDSGGRDEGGVASANPDAGRATRSSTVVNPGGKSVGEIAEEARQTEAELQRQEQLAQRQAAENNQGTETPETAQQQTAVDNVFEDLLTENGTSTPKGRGANGFSAGLPEPAGFRGDFEQVYDDGQTAKRYQEPNETVLKTPWQQTPRSHSDNTNTREKVPQEEETPATLFDQWQNMIQQENADVNEQAFGTGPEENRLVAPTQRVLGTYPAGTMNFLNENGLGIEWLQTPAGQEYLANAQATTPVTAGVSSFGDAIVNNRGNGYVSTNYLRENPGTSYTPPTSAADRNLGNFEAFLELGRDQGLSGRELVEYAADELNRNSRGNGYVPTDSLRGIVSTPYQAPDPLAEFERLNTPKEDILEAEQIREDRLQRALENTPEQYRNSDIPDTFDFWAKLGAGMSNQYNVGNDKRRWVADQMSNMSFDTDWDMMAAEQALEKQYDEQFGTSRVPVVGSNEIRERINAIRDNEREHIDTIRKNAEKKDADYDQALAIAAQTEEVGSPEYYRKANDIYEDIRDTTPTPMAPSAELERQDQLALRQARELEAANAAKRERLDQETADMIARQNRRNEVKANRDALLLDYFKDLGYNDDFARAMLENPALYEARDYANANDMGIGQAYYRLNNPGQYDENGNLIAAGINDVVWAPPAVNADGTPNATLQAIMDGQMTNDISDAVGTPAEDVVRKGNAENILRLFDQPGGVVIPKDVEDYLATTNANARGMLDLSAIVDNGTSIVDTSNPQNVEFVKDDKYKENVEKFLNANPALATLVINGQLTIDDIVDHFFKAPESSRAQYADKIAEKTAGSGTGTSGKPQTLPASYGQGDKVVKAPYRKGGYTEEELKAMGNNPYKDYRGYDAYEGYYYNYNDKKWYPVDQDKANYYNRYGTYRGWQEPMREYWNTFGTFSGYTPNWKQTGRSGGGGGYRRSYSSYSGGSYSPTYSNQSNRSSGSNRVTPVNYANQNVNKTPVVRNQQEQRINNIMKNWSF